MNPALVSVVIPTYNYGHFVVEAVESVLAQTYPDLEIIVVDDGSTDDTRARLDPYMGRICYVYQHNQGLSAARNTGIRAAKSQWIAFLDSDDQWHPRKLEVQMTYLDRHPDVAMLATDAVTDLSGGWPEIALDFDPPAERIRLEEIVIGSRFGSCGVVVRKECFEKSGLFDTELRSAEDRDMWIRISCHYPVAKLQVPLWWYRVHGLSMSFVVDRMITNERKVLQKSFAEHRILRRNWLLRLQAFSHFHRSAAITYEQAGMHVRAAARILWSMAMWPFPFPQRSGGTPLERSKMSLMILLRMLRLKQPQTVPR